MTIVRRYVFKLYPAQPQADALHEQRKMMADLWNAMLQRWEDVQSRTQQRQTWYDPDGKRRRGVTVHRPVWQSQCMREGIIREMGADKRGRPRPMTAFDLQNECTWLANELPEWRELSIWCLHRTATKLMRAIEAFYRRAGGGAGKSSGYPRYKSRARADSIPHRFASGCALTKDARHMLSWRVRLKGVPGEIHARGWFPTAVTKFTDADVMWRDGKWWISIAVEMGGRRDPGIKPMHVYFDCLGALAAVNGIPETPAEFGRIFALQDRLDRLKSRFDEDWPRGRRLSDEQKIDRADDWRQIAGLAAKIARIRQNALHVWTARIVRQASELTITAPAVREATRTPRGDDKRWGANIEVVSDINRQALSFAPAMAVAMLQYKAEEAGIRCHVITDEAPPIAVGGDLVNAGKTLRRACRETKRAA